MGKYFKIVIEEVSGRKQILTLEFTTLLEMEIAYRVLLTSIVGTACYIRTLALDDSGNWNGYEID